MRKLKITFIKQTIYLLLTVIFAVSCSKDDDLEKVNTALSAFEITATVLESRNEVTITWTEATDADGDVVTYDVVYGVDTVAKGLTTRNYTFKDLPYETVISGVVVASDGKGGKSETMFSKVT